jgi:hypothetical protein
MKARDEHLEVRLHGFSLSSPLIQSPAASQTLKKDALEELAAFCKSAEYHQFIKKLIVQGLIKIEEDVVEVHARAEDHAIVKRMVRAGGKANLLCRNLPCRQSTRIVSSH